MKEIAKARPTLFVNKICQAAESDTESQNQRQRQLVGNIDPVGGGGELSLTDAPESIRSVAGSQMNQVQIWPNLHIVGTIQQLGGARKVGEHVRILLNAIGDCENQITAVALQRNEELQRRGNFSDENDRELRQRQRYDFCKKVWGWIRTQTAEKIQVVEPIVHNDVLARLDIGCESFRGGKLETQLSRVRDIAGKLVQGANQLVIDVDRKLIQNSQRSKKRGEMIKGLYTAMREFIGGREESER